MNDDAPLLFVVPLLAAWAFLGHVTAEQLPPPQRTLLGKVAYLALAPIRAVVHFVWGLALDAPAAAAEVLDVVSDTVVPEASRPVRRADEGALSLTDTDTSGGPRG